MVRSRPSVWKTAVRVPAWTLKHGAAKQDRSLQTEERVPEEEKKEKEREGKRTPKKRKKVLFNSKYLDLKHNLCLFSSLSWQIQILHLHLLLDPPVLGTSPDSSPVPPTAPHFSVHAGLEPASSRPGRLSSYRWATGTFTLTLLFFAVLSFLSGQNQISRAKTQFSEHRATRAVSRLLSDPFILDLCLFWGV